MANKINTKQVEKDANGRWVRVTNTNLAGSHSMEVQERDDGTSLIIIECSIMHTKHQIVVPTENFKRWVIDDGYIQQDLSMLSRSDRELILSGVSPEGMNKLFPED